MGAHNAPRSSSHAARLAGRGALTAAAALALAGGTASLAFASEVPSVPTTQDISGHATSGTHDLQDATKKASKPSTDAASGMKANAGHFASNTKNDTQHAAHHWGAAAKGGITPSEASQQLGLMKADLGHAAHHGKADMTDLGSSLSS